MKKELNALFQEKTEAPGGLVDQLIPIYNKYFTHEEIKRLYAFYQTDLGQKVIRTMPKATSEAMVAGEAWGQSLGPEIMQRLQEAVKREGIELPKQ